MSDDVWWKTLGFGLLFLGLTWFLHDDFSGFEELGRRRRFRHWMFGQQLAAWLGFGP